MIKKVIEVVKEASEILMKNNFKLYEKTDATNIVTSADLEIQEFLKYKLREIFPEAGFFGEEKDAVEIKEYFWLVDPIDGTTNFSRHLNFSAISVALIHNNQAILGVVYNAFTNELFYAEKGKGAYLNDQKLFVSNKKFESSLLCTAMSLYKKELAQYCFDIIKDAYYQCNDIRRLGSCALELCYIASGKCDLYFEIRVCPWDYAAAGLILQEAGGYLCAFQFNELKYDQPVTLIGANTKNNFNKLYSIVSNHIKEKLNLQ